MELISRYLVLEYSYDSIEERDSHIKYMKSQGWDYKWKEDRMEASIEPMSVSTSPKIKNFKIKKCAQFTKENKNEETK
jgi:hypothetical protein